MLSSKGAAGVTGAGFITLAATLAVVPEVPVAGMALILGVDRFMSECRSLTNFIGNAVATVVVSRWENALDYERAPGRCAERPRLASHCGGGACGGCRVPVTATARTWPDCLFWWTLMAAQLFSRPLKIPADAGVSQYDLKPSAKEQPQTER